MSLTKMVLAELESFVVNQKAVGAKQVNRTGLVDIGSYITKTTDFHIPKEFLEDLATRTGGVYKGGNKARIVW